jgi:hypothetical protein
MMTLIKERRRRRSHQGNVPASSSASNPSEFPTWAYETRSFLRFEILHESTKSGVRVGRIHTPHGIVDTPSFVAVATNGSDSCPDSRIDSRINTRTDSGPDAVTDTRTDSGADSCLDSRIDALTDNRTDSGTYARTDSGPDARNDTQTDSGADSCPNSRIDA